MYISYISSNQLGIKETNLSESFCAGNSQLLIKSLVLCTSRKLAVTNLVSKRPNSVNHHVVVIIRLLINSLVLCTSHKLAVTNLVSKRPNSVNHLLLVIMYISYISGNQFGNKMTKLSESSCTGNYVHLVK